MCVCIRLLSEDLLAVGAPCWRALRMGSVKRMRANREGVRIREARRKNIRRKERKKIMYPDEAIRKSLQCSCINPQGSLNLRKGSPEVVETLCKCLAIRLSSIMSFWIEILWLVYFFCIVVRDVDEGWRMWIGWNCWIWSVRLVLRDSVGTVLGLCCGFLCVQILKLEAWIVRSIQKY